MWKITGHIRRFRNRNGVGLLTYNTERKMILQLAFYTQLNYLPINFKDGIQTCSDMLQVWWTGLRGLLQGDGGGAEPWSSMEGSQWSLGKVEKQPAACCMIWTHREQLQKQQLEDWEVAASEEWESGTERESQRMAVCHCKPWVTFDFFNYYFGQNTD